MYVAEISFACACVYMQCVSWVPCRRPRASISLCPCLPASLAVARHLALSLSHSLSLSLSLCAAPRCLTATGLRTQGYHTCQELLSEGELQRLREHAMAVLSGEYETRRPPMNCNPADPRDPTKPHPDLVLRAPMHHSKSR